MIKNKLIKVVLFFAVSVGVNILVIHYYSKMMGTSVEFTRDLQFEKADKTNAEILAIGDSHPEWALWDVYFHKKMVKWVSPGESYIQNYYKLEYYLSDYPARCVILPVDLHSFSSSNTTNISNDFFWVKYIDYFELGVISGDFRGYFLRYLKGAFFPYAGESNTIYEWVVKKYFTESAENPPLPVTDNPHVRFKYPVNYVNLSVSTSVAAKYNWSFVEEAKRLTKASTRVDSQVGKRYDYFCPLMTKYFRKILTLCKEKGIAVFLVKFPISYEYYECASQIFDVDEFYKKVGSLVTMCGNAYILDYQKDFFSRPDLIADPDHVNGIGAQIVSRKINAEIDKFF
jgi:hypothetical protein